MTDKPIYAWHFSTDELDFDRKGTKVEAGLTVSMDDKPILSFKGFHACVRPLDALYYFAQRPNPNNLVIVSRVRLSGQTIDDTPAETMIVLSEDDEIGIEAPVEYRTVPVNIVSQKREHLWIADAKSTIDAFGVQCYEEALRLLRERNYAIAPIFDDAIKARLENSDDLPALAKSARDEVAAIELKPLLECLAVSLTMNVIEFALSSADTLIRINKHRDFKDREEARRFSQEIRDIHYKTWQTNHEKLHKMLMQLAPEGYHEP